MERNCFRKENQEVLDINAGDTGVRLPGAVNRRQCLGIWMRVSSLMGRQEVLEVGEE